MFDLDVRDQILFLRVDENRSRLAMMRGRTGRARTLYINADFCVVWRCFFIRSASVFVSFAFFFVLRLSIVAYRRNVKVPCLSFF